MERHQPAVVLAAEIGAEAPEGGLTPTSEATEFADLCSHSFFRKKISNLSFISERSGF